MGDGSEMFLLVAEKLRARFPKLYSVSRNPVFSWSMLAIIFLWWILRNCFGW